MASYTHPNSQMTEADLIATLEAAVPVHSYRAGPRSWTWTRPNGIWHINLGYHEENPSTLKARLDGSPSELLVCVRTTRREINAALRWLVLVDAIDRHPDDPQTKSADD